MHTKQKRNKKNLWNRKESVVMALSFFGIKIQMNFYATKKSSEYLKNNLKEEKITKNEYKNSEINKERK